jgi:hypothetical protein
MLKEKATPCFGFRSMLEVDISVCCVLISLRRHLSTKAMQCLAYRAASRVDERCTQTFDTVAQVAEVAPGYIRDGQAPNRALLT